MGLLKGLWNGLGDLYDSVDNTSEVNYNNYSRSQGSPKVRVSWRGNYKSTTGYWCTADVNEVIPLDMFKRLSADWRATSMFLKKVIYDCEELESEVTQLNFEGYV